LDQKNQSVESRLASSEKEIKSLHTKIANLSKSKSEPEVQNLIEIHQAAINIHTDISEVAKTELVHDREQQEEIRRLMENLLKDMKKIPANKIDRNKVNEEIDQLKESQTTLDAARLRIIALINKLDPNRTPTGASKILNECDQKKRKLDDAFARTPGSTPGNSKQAKRMRPATPNKSTPQKSTRQQGQQQIAEAQTMDVELATTNPAPALLAPFLPPTAAKLMLLVDGRFSSIEWYQTTTKIPMGEDISNSFGSWTTTLQTGHQHFLMQTFSHGMLGALAFLPVEYRIIAIDPTAQVHQPDTQCVPLAITKNKQEAVQFLDLIGEIEDHQSFDYDATWRLLSKDS